MNARHSACYLGNHHLHCTALHPAHSAGSASWRISHCLTSIQRRSGLSFSGLLSQYQTTQTANTRTNPPKPKSLQLVPPVRPDHIFVLLSAGLHYTFSCSL